MVSVASAASGRGVAGGGGVAGGVGVAGVGGDVEGTIVFPTLICQR